MRVFHRLVLTIPFLLVLGTWAMAEFTVTVRLEDGTNGGPGQADTLQLIQLQQGMTPVAAESEASGTVSLTFDGSFAAGQFLVQARKGQTVYTESLTDIQNELVITVFDNAETADTRAAIGSLALYVQHQNLDVGMFINVDNINKPPVTLVREGATFQWPLIPGYRGLEVSTRRGKMPLKQSPLFEGDKAGLSYPLRPGRTQIMARSNHAYNPSDATNIYRLPLLEDQKAMHILVMPASLELSGDGLTFVEVDKVNDLRLYEWKRLENQDVLELNLTGKAEPDPTAAGNNQTAETQREPGEKRTFKRLPNQLSHDRVLIVGSILGLLAVFACVGLMRR
ncbi:hypothetical protein [Acanthopleuribacter pedis]|uniref:Transmembrane protein n=1 Tax=Acanthopleuribacter pedis TaxID=442870 RepID=A0A8J7U543_9BACT|nr:hypothetical protein [Acanthopleuribacter pedis]MBO1322143.1 hypothetical protein [Acanthopleuribacter pedis]